MKRRRLVAVGAVAAFALVGGVAWATIPDGSGVIHTCFSQANGTWRPIDFPKDKCKAGETQLDFNQQGPKGDVGPAGPQGPKGDKGDTGAAGPKGDQGLQGIQGLPGNDGKDGAPGATGAPGPAGSPGPSGVSGYQVIYGVTRFLDPFEGFSVTVTCPTGKRVLGGGYWGQRIAADINAPFSAYSGEPANDGWHVAGTTSAIGGFVVPFTICANV